MIKFSTRQVCFFFAFLMPVSKLITAPSTIVYYSKNNLLFSAIISFIAQTFIIFLTLLMTKNNPDKTFFQIMQEKVGVVWARVIYFLYGLYFLFSALLPILEQKNYANSIFYDTVPSLFSFMPFFFLSLYIASKKIKSIGRIADIAMPIFIISFLNIILLGLPNADFSALLPIGSTGAQKVLNGSYNTMVWFVDSAYLLALLGNFKRDEKSTHKILLSYIGGALFVLVFLAIFYGVFSEIAIRQFYAISKLPKYSVSLASIGRADYVAIYAITVIMMIYNIVPLLFSSNFFAQSLSIKRQYIPAIAVNAVVFFVVIIFSVAYSTLSQAITTRLNIVFVLFVYVLPIFCLLFKVKKKPKKKVTKEGEDKQYE